MKKNLQFLISSRRLTSCVFLPLCILFLSTGMVLAQDATVSGVVKDEAGTATPGVNILVKGTNRGTVTDSNGRFAIGASQGEILVFSFIGYATQEISVANQSEINISLQPDVVALQEVVVTGYQTQRRADLTGAVAVVNMENARDVPSGGTLKSIQGMVPGLYIQSDGSPNGRATAVSIRGVNTLGNTNPLYVIDGVPTTDPNVLQSMSPNSIESIQVLKDASAASIYGSRASNGVIIVTTKQGRGTLNVAFNTSFTVQQYMRKFDMANTDQYGRILWQGAVNDNPAGNPNNSFYTYDWHMAGGVPVLDAVNPVPFINGDPMIPTADTDWQEEVFQTGYISSNTLTISGSTEKSSSLVDLSYFYNKGLVLSTKFERVNMRINNSFDFFDGKLKIGENLQLSVSSSVPTPADAARSVISLATDIVPVLPVYKTDGTFAGPIGAGFSDRANPVHMAEVDKNNRNDDYVAFGNIYAELSPIENLTFRSSLGVEPGLLRSKLINPRWQEGFLSNTINSLAISETQQFNWTWSNTLAFRLIKERSRWSFLAGMEAIKNRLNTLGAAREQFAIDDVNYFYLSSGTGVSTNSGTGTGNQLLSYFGNVTYAFSDKYLAAATLRYDGSSRFGENYEYGFFPAVSAGWVVSKEAFMVGASFVSNLKVRAGFGKVGNQQIADYARFQLWVPNYGSTGNVVNFVSGTAYDLGGADTGNLPAGYEATQSANPNLKWEATSEVNVGIDFGLLNQKINGSFDYFTRQTEDILTTPPYLGVVGEGGSQTVNGATMENSGWEFVLGYKNASGGFTYGVTANISHFADKITYLPPSVVRNYPGNTEKTIVGQSRTAMFGYITDGLFQSTEEVAAHAAQPGKGVGRIRYTDLNSDGVINALDQDWLGTTNPKLIYGVNGQVGYKNLSLSLFVRGVQGVLINDQAKLEKNSFLGLVAGQNKGTSLLDAWTPQNTGSTIPLLSFNNNNMENRSSDYTVVNGSYLRLQNIQLNYTFSQDMVSAINLQSLRLYFLAENTLLFFDSKGTNAFTGPDPESPVTGTAGGLNAQGVNIGGYPRPVSFTFGLDVRF